MDGGMKMEQWMIAYKCSTEGRVCRLQFEIASVSGRSNDGESGWQINDKVSGGNKVKSVAGKKVWMNSA